MVKRQNLHRQIQKALRRSRVVGLMGPRQCGKTTMARGLVSTDSPKSTPSMKIAFEDLQLERILVIYPGTRRYTIADRVEAVPFEEVVRGDANSLLHK